MERHVPWLHPESQQARDLERFRWFSNGYVAPHPRDPRQVIDLRYSMLPNEIEPLWTIRLDPAARRDAHVEYLTAREAGPATLTRFRRMLYGE